MAEDEPPAISAAPVAPVGLVREAVRRPLAARWAVYTEEVARLVEATYRVVERTGSLDPTVREILREAGLSNQAFYRHFRSKDELLVALLDDGRRRMAEYLRRRMAAADDTASRVRAWVEGVLAQAGDPVAAARTRPFLAHQDRLAEQFPAEQRDSVAAMLAPLEEVLREAYAQPANGQPAGQVARQPEQPAGQPEVPAPRPPHDPAADALAVYRLTLATLHDHLRARTAPAAEETAHLVRFACRGLGISVV